MLKFLDTWWTEMYHLYSSYMNKFIYTILFRRKIKLPRPRFCEWPHALTVQALLTIKIISLRFTKTIVVNFFIEYLIYVSSLYTENQWINQLFISNENELDLANIKTCKEEIQDEKLMVYILSKVYNFFLSCFCIKKWTPPTPYKNKHDMRTLCISFLKSFRRISVCIGWLIHTFKGTWMEKYIWPHFV